MDFYAIGLAVYPMTLNEYYAMQEEAMKKQEEAAEGKAEGVETEVDLDKANEGKAEWIN